MKRARTFVERLWPRRRVKVLAFTCSARRPLMLRHCILQIRQQTYPTDHVIYVNVPEGSDAEMALVDYSALLDDVSRGSRTRIRIAHGQSGTLHKNFVSALRLIDVEEYDIFLKVDDDDIYMRNYTKEIVDDFQIRKWDYSGTSSWGILNGFRWNRDMPLSDLGLAEEDLALGVPKVMPPSVAFSRKAINSVLTLSDEDGFEDIRWRRHLASAPAMVLATRRDRNFVYNIHGGNVSTGTSFKP